MCSSRTLFWALSLIGGLAAAALYSWVTPTFDALGGPRAVAFFGIGIFGFAMIFLAPRQAGRERGLWILWLPAILLRLALLPAAPSDDINRYVWEGNLVREGISPYAHTADAPEWAAYRDGYWEQMNHRDRLTAYPPIAELIFAATTTGENPIASFKFWILAADLFALFGIVRLLRRRGLQIHYAGFYAFNPVVLVAFAAEAHFDVFLVAPLVWALLAFESGSKRLAVTLAALATGIKWVTLPILPFFARFSLSTAVAIIIAVLGLPALIFWNTLPSLVSGLLGFGGNSSFNGPVHSLLHVVIGLPQTASLALVLTGFAAVVAWRWWCRPAYPLDSHLRWILGALLVFSPTVHFWYLTWIIPFICLRPTIPWILLSISSGMYFLVWTTHAEEGAWALSPLQVVAFWAPFFIGLIYEFLTTRGRCAFAPIRAGGESSDSVAVVIPALNAKEHLGTALQSVAAQEPPPSEIILVDGGSTDGTPQTARSINPAITLIEGPRGRGNQIAVGIEAASAEWVIVLHADAVLAGGSTKKLLAAVKAMPAVIGGAFGQRFEADRPKLVLIEVLNDLRALFSRTAFGDQVQFFHRPTAISQNLMPAQPLMEDVESSWRVRETGEFLFLNHPCSVSDQRWRRSRWFARFLLVARLVSQYRFARLRGRETARKLSLDLYQEYYHENIPPSIETSKRPERSP